MIKKIKLILLLPDRVAAIYECLVSIQKTFLHVANSLQYLEGRIKELERRSEPTTETRTTDEALRSADAENLKVAINKIKGPGLRVLMPQRPRRPGEEH